MRALMLSVVIVVFCLDLTPFPPPPSLPPIVVVCVFSLSLLRHHLVSCCVEGSGEASTVMVSLILVLMASSCPPTSTIFPNSSHPQPQCCSLRIASSPHRDLSPPLLPDASSHCLWFVGVIFFSPGLIVVVIIICTFAPPVSTPSSNLIVDCIGKLVLP